MDKPASRRSFLAKYGAQCAAALAAASTAQADDDKPKIQGFEEEPGAKSSKVWKPVSDRKIRIGHRGVRRLQSSERSSPCSIIPTSRWWR